MSQLTKKGIIALTGLGLSLFVLVHALGNILIFFGPKAYNLYSHKLITNPAIEVVEFGLLAVFLAHLGLALGLTVQNRRARGQPYAVQGCGPKATGLIQKTLWQQGIVILVFVVLHLITFKFGKSGPGYEAVYDGIAVRDLHRLVIETFQMPLYVIYYGISLLVLGFHLSHGLASTFQTLGSETLGFSRFARVFSWGFSALVTLTFLSQPLYVFFFYKE